MKRMARRLVAVTAVLTATCASAEVIAIPAVVLADATNNVMTSGSTAADGWNNGANWTLAHPPSGTESAVVNPGIAAYVQNTITPAYGGSLTLSTNSSVRILNAGGSQNAVQSPTGITMQVGSKIEVNINANINFPPIRLEGDATLASLFGASDWQTDNFAAITGPHTLTISGFNGHTYNLNAANTFTNLVADAIDRWGLTANAAGALGTGDVTVNPRTNNTDGRSAVVIINAADAMADAATLTLNGNGWAGSNGGPHAGAIYKIVMNADDTVGKLIVDEVELPPGDYTDASGTWISGPGTLTVIPPVPPLPSGMTLIVR